MPGAPRVLFVCVENSCRSQLAEAFAIIHGDSMIEAKSAGSQPAGAINPKAAESMRELGYDLRSHRSKPLSSVLDTDYDIVVSMGCGDDLAAIRTEEVVTWDIPDPKQMNIDDFREVRDLIESQVKSLIAELSRGEEIED
ncbi:MAG: arsenate reductase ArsC [Planctomycetes bacterium]|nr:arsenate reductase ArsC [Planctomycetota bacterium]